ncbi:MAG: hypothetical protein VXZ88_02915 [Verrucomicrobiota bacterium]|nr:hypothetical protein [Verrucomicrobiota bacterium]
MQFKHTPLTLATLFLFGTMFAGSAVDGEVPAFVKESLYSPNAATVAMVTPMLAADVVILDGGLEQGIRLGMVCRVTRGLQSVGELIIIESRSDQSAGLILELFKDSTIQAGDIARIKTIQNS